MALSAMDGYNVCIFAYGQTGSGKTYTMKSLTSMICRRLFSSRDGFKTSVCVSYVEIYNNEVRDLLRNPKAQNGRTDWNQSKHFGKAPSLDVRVNSKGVVEVDSIEVSISCAEEVQDLVRRGTELRSTFSTDLNKHSSRSHALLTLRCEVVNEWAGLKHEAKLHLVDLAGSERLNQSHAKGERLKETKFINGSLSALGNVMSALAKEQPYVPFRDSKLTMLLSDSLAGNSKVVMMMCVKEGASEASETAFTLQFGMRARRIRFKEAVASAIPIEAEPEEGEKLPGGGAENPPIFRGKKGGGTNGKLPDAIK